MVLTAMGGRVVLTTWWTVFVHAGTAPQFLVADGNGCIVGIWGP